MCDMDGSPLVQDKVWMWDRELDGLGVTLTLLPLLDVVQNVGDKARLAGETEVAMEREASPVSLALLRTDRVLDWVQLLLQGASDCENLIVDDRVTGWEFWVGDSELDSEVSVREALLEVLVDSEAVPVVDWEGVTLPLTVVGDTERLAGCVHAG